MRKTHSIGAVIGVLMMGGCSSPPKHLVAGSKLTVENSILGEILAQHIQNRLKVSVDRRPGMLGAMMAHQALLGGEIDLYAEDAGTAYYSSFRLPPANDMDILNSRVAIEYQNLKIRWMAPLGYVSTFVVAASADKVKAATLSRLADSDKPVSISYNLDFRNRLDGFASMMRTYELNLSALPMIVAPNLVGVQLTKRLSHIAVVDASDPVLFDAKVKVVEDDKKAFNSYPVAIVVRERALAANPPLEGALRQLEGKVSLEAIRKLNDAVVRQGKTPAAAAAEFLQQAGLK